MNAAESVAASSASSFALSVGENVAAIALGSV